LKDVNPMLATVAMVQLRKEPAFEVAYHQLEAALKLPENRVIARSYRHYVKEVGEYLTVRHPVSLRLMIFIMILLDRPKHPGDIHVSSDPKTSGESVAPIFGLSPQTSTLLKYSIGPEVYSRSSCGIQLQS